MWVAEYETLSYSIQLTATSSLKKKKKAVVKTFAGINFFKNTTLGATLQLKLIQATNNFLW